MRPGCGRIERRRLKPRPGCGRLKPRLRACGYEVHLRGLEGLDVGQKALHLARIAFAQDLLFVEGARDAACVAPAVVVTRHLEMGKLATACETDALGRPFVGLQFVLFHGDPLSKMRVRRACPASIPHLRGGVQGAVTDGVHFIEGATGQKRLIALQ
jgi:hypothetical protein